MRKAIEKFLFDMLCGAGTGIILLGIVVVTSYAWHFGQMILYKQEGYPTVVNNNFNMQDGTTAKIGDKTLE